MSGLRKNSIPGSDATLRTIAALLARLSKHLALLGCFMILGSASGREAFAQLTIFFTIMIAALLHGTGRYLQHRLLRGPSILRHDR